MERPLAYLWKRTGGARGATRWKGSHPASTARLAACDQWTAPTASAVRLARWIDAAPAPIDTGLKGEKGDQGNRGENGAKG